MKYTFFITLMALLACQSINAKEYIVVSRSNSESQSINRDIVKDIYLGSKLFWKDGTRIQAIHLPITDKSFNTFLENIIEMDTNQFLSYWRRKLFSGRAHPPKQMKKDEEIIKFVEQNPDSIAVLHQKPKRESKTLYIIELD